MSVTIAPFIQHESIDHKPIRNPAKVIPRDFITSSPPTEVELNALQWGRQLNGPYKAQKSIELPPYPSTIRDLESSQPSTPEPVQAVDALVQSWNNPARNKWRLLGAGFMFTMMGLSDAATGAVLPYMERDYHIGYAVVSLIFVGNAAGFICAAPFVQAIDRALGRSRSYMLVNTLSTIAFALILAGLPFPVIVCAYFLLGFGLGVFLAMTNLYIVNLVNGVVILGFMHALYGLGGVLSPIIATAMISAGVEWHYFYAITLALSLVSFGLMGWAFKGFEEDAPVQLLTALERTASRQLSIIGEASSAQLLKQAFKEKCTILGAIFILFYQGAEVSISGWVISFLINYRKEDPRAAGNVTSGFWGGVTLGRVILTPFAVKVGEKPFVIILIVISAIMQIVVWQVPNLIGAAVAQALCGLALGPIYPCATSLFSKLLPKSVAIPAISFVTSMGSSGGAVIPLITGLMAQRLGTVVLHPIVLFSCAMMMLSWALLPKLAKRTN